MTDEIDAKEIVGFALMPVRPGEYTADGGNLGILPRNAGSDNNPQTTFRMEIIVNHLHFCDGKPIHAGNGVEGKPFAIQFDRGGHHVFGRD